jgi:hypothetical protein
MGRREEDSPIARKEVSAGRLPTSGRDATHVRAVDVHDELLIAAPTAPRRLEDQALTVVTEVRLRILAAEGELPDVS